MTNWISNPIFDGEEKRMPIAVITGKTVAAAKKIGFQPLTFDASKLGKISGDAALVNLPEYFETCFSALQPTDILAVQLLFGLSPDYLEIERLSLEELRRKGIRLIALLPRIDITQDLSDIAALESILDVLSYFDVLITASSQLIKQAECVLPELKIIKLELLDFLDANIALVSDGSERVLLSLGEPSCIADSKVGIQTQIIELNDLLRQPFIEVKKSLAWIGSNDASWRDLDIIRLSLYLVTGQVVLISQKSELSDFISDRELGIVVADKEEEVLSACISLTDNEFKYFTEKVRAFQTALSQGKYIQQALLEAFQILKLHLAEESCADTGTRQNYSEFKNWLLSRIFYYCEAESYKKIAIWRFEADGRLSGIGSSREKSWQLHHHRLEILDESGRAVSSFWIPPQAVIKSSQRIPGFPDENYESQLFLAASSLTEIESLTLPPDTDLECLMIAGTESYNALCALARQHKLIDGSFHQQYFIVPAQALDIGLPKISNLSYRLDLPAENESYLTKKLVVSFGVPKGGFTVDARSRLASDSRLTPFISKSAKNTYLLRPVELNFGTDNTVLFPSDEEKKAMNELILTVAEQQGIAKENTLLYGYGESGNSALAHALYGDFSAVIFEPKSFTSRFSAAAEENPNIQIIFSKSPQFNENKEALKKISCQIKEIELDEQSSPDSTAITNIEITLLNNWLYATDIEIMEGDDD
jgi:hypothetical protein